MTRPDWFDASLFPFESRFVQVDGARVHYVDEGQGPILLMLHGQPTWSFLYGDLIQRLREDCRCVALDYPGFGLSEAPAGYGYRIHEHVGIVEGFVERLGLHGITPLMSDWGGPIGLALAVRHPDRVHGFVIGNTWGDTDVSVRARVFSRVLGGLPGHLLVRHLDVFTERMLPKLRQRPLTEEEHAMYRGPHPTPESRVPLQVMPREIVAARPLLEEIERGIDHVADRPALVVWGGRDPIFGEDKRRRFERAFPDHRTLVLDDAGHFLWADRPERIASEIRVWVNEKAGGRTGR